jgi:glycosyltransferase involved in cell wall biosynthesis
MRLLYVSDTDRVHDRRFVAAYRDAGIETEALALGGVADPCALVADELARIRPDVVHAGPMTTAAWAAVQAGAPCLVAMSWGSDVLRDAELDAELADRVREVCEHATLVQCDSAPVESALVHAYGVDPARIVRFPWGIDTDRFSPGLRPKALAGTLDIGLDDLVVLSTRNFEPVYDIPTLLDAFARAAAEEPRLRLVVLGGGSGEHDAREFVAARGLDDRVRFVGHVDNADLPDYFRLADVYLACSLSDGASVSLLEAMSTALPVVVSDIPGNREWVHPLANGWLATVGVAEEFAESMLDAVHLEADLRAEIGAHNRAVAVTRATWDTNVVRLVEAVRALV